MQISIWYHTSAWRTSFNISCSAGLQAVNPFLFCLRKSLLKDIFAEHIILNWLFCFSYYLKMFHYFLDYIVWQKSAVIFIFLCEKCVFLCLYKIFLFIFKFQHCNYNFHSCVIFMCIYLAWDFLRFKVFSLCFVFPFIKFRKFLTITSSIFFFSSPSSYSGNTFPYMLDWFSSKILE